MATYFARIPADVPARQIFDAVSGEVVCSMAGICVTAFGDERMGHHFSVSSDEVFKACTDPMEIFKKICDGSSIGNLCVSGAGWSVRLSRHHPRVVVDDNSVPNREYYSVTVTLIAHACFGDDAATKQEYDKWLDLLEEPDTLNRVTQSWSTTKDVLMGYRIRASKVPAFMRRLGLVEHKGVQAHGDVQEKDRFTHFPVDLARYGFRGLYSIYPSWPIYRITNYPSEAYTRFCDLVDARNSGMLVSLGRRNCAFRCKDGRTTRTLDGNCFDVYQTKTRRSLSISFDQYADEDPPVRTFSGGVRARLANLRTKI